MFGPVSQRHRGSTEAVKLEKDKLQVADMPSSGIRGKGQACKMQFTAGALSSVTLVTNNAYQYMENYAFDTQNRVSSLTRVIGDKTYATRSEYNQANQPTKLTYPSGKQVILSYDDRARRKQRREGHGTQRRQRLEGSGLTLLTFGLNPSFSALQWCRKQP